MSDSIPSRDYSEFAPAKVNLALHLLHRREDGYHELDSLVAFLSEGDVLHAELTGDHAISMSVEGAFSHGLSHEENLVLRAAHLLRIKTGVNTGVRFRLEKRVPVGAGLGGGSADAAAALRLLNRIWDTNFSQKELAHIGEELGADVPACVLSQTLRMQGIGEILSPVASFPALECVVAYPGTPLWTADVYRAMEPEDFSGSLPVLPAIADGLSVWLPWLRESRNDLQKAADMLNGDVPRLLHYLADASGCLLARMSGSGSACFGIFDQKESAALAVKAIAARFPNGWVKQASILAE